MKFVLSSSTYFRRKSAFSTDIPFPIKTIARSRDVAVELNIAQHIFPSRTGMGVRVNSGSLEDVFSEDGDSNSLSLVYDSDGDNPESSGESGTCP